MKKLYVLVLVLFLASCGKNDTLIEESKKELLSENTQIVNEVIEDETEENLEEVDFVSVEDLQETEKQTEAEVEEVIETEENISDNIQETETNEVIKESVKEEVISETVVETSQETVTEVPVKIVEETTEIPEVEEEKSELNLQDMQQDLGIDNDSLNIVNPEDNLVSEIWDKTKIEEVVEDEIVVDAKEEITEPETTETEEIKVEEIKSENTETTTGEEIITEEEISEEDYNKDYIQSDFTQEEDDELGIANLDCSNTDSITDFVLNAESWAYWNTCREIQEGIIKFNVLSLKDDTYKYERYFVNKNDKTLTKILLQVWMWVTSENIWEKNSELKQKDFNDEVVDKTYLDWLE